jgi:PAS domain S-box-containing protein
MSERLSSPLLVAAVIVGAVVTIALRDLVALVAVLGLVLLWLLVRSRRLNESLRREIAERERVHDELRGSEGRLQAVVTGVVDGIVTLDEHGVVSSANATALQMFGYGEEELIGQPITCVLPEQKWEELTTFAGRDMLAGAKRWPRITAEVSGRKRDDSTFPMELCLSQMTLGPRRMFVGIVRDITARREWEHRINAVNEQLQVMTRLQQAILDGADCSIISTDQRGVIRSFNAAAERLLGYSAGEVIGRHTPEIIHDDTEVTERAAALSLELGRPIAPGFETFVAKARMGEPYESEWTYIRKDGSAFPVLLSVTALRGEHGELTGFLGIGRDITRRREDAERLRRAKEVAEAANLAKSQFLANMSHELRTPLNGIMGYSYLLREEARERGLDSIVPDLDQIYAAGKHLLDLINDILDLAKIEAGRVELHLEEFDVSAMLDGVVTTVSPLTSRNGNTLVRRGTAELGTMRADLTRIRQILFNLLSNAAKFTENGTITLEADRSADWITLTVADTGIGMTPEELDRVFDEFAQADPSTTRRYGGTGLGLTITREVCQLMGGSIDVVSRPGHGSRFTVRVPAAGAGVAAERPPAPVEAPSARPVAPEPPDIEILAHGGETVLVIDDDPLARELLSRSLSRDGFHVVTCASGADGIERARALRPIAITLDIMMPQMDGWSVISRLKSDPELADIPVVVVTMVDDHSMGYALGAAEYLTKPVDRDRLLAVLRRFRRDAAPASILVVEDDANVRDALARVLVDAGWRVTEAEYGRAALDLVRRDRPELILLDLLMPEMNGFELVAELKHAPETAAIPIVVVTSVVLSASERARLSRDVARILDKGEFHTDELLAEVRSLVRASVAPRPTPTLEATS